MLRDATADATLRRDGYVVVDGIGPPAAAELRAAYGELHGWEMRRHNDDQPPDFEVDSTSADLDYRGAAARRVAATLDPMVSAVFVQHRPAVCAYNVKWPSDGGDADWVGVPNSFHNDSTWVDESDGTRAYMVWVPVQDTGAHNGGLHVVPRSHELPRTLRGFDIAPSWLSHDEVFRRHARTVDVAAGQALVFDPAIVHRSGPNRSPDARVVTIALVVPPDTQLCYFRRIDDRRAEKVLAPDDVFASISTAAMISAPSSGVVDYEDHPLTAAELDARLAGRRRAWPAIPRRLRSA